MSASNAAERRTRKDMRRNLERVLQAANELFAERGTDVTMEEVARRAGVGVGTIYRRFPSKEMLFAAVSHAVCADTQHCLHQAAEEARDPVSKLRALVLVQYRRSEQQTVVINLRPGPASETDTCAEASQSCAASEQQLYAALHAMLQQVIDEGQRQGTIRQGDPAVLAAICLELLSPRTFQNLHRVVGGRAEDVAEHAVRFVLGGLGVCAER